MEISSDRFFRKVLAFGIIAACFLAGYEGRRAILKTRWHEWLGLVLTDDSRVVHSPDSPNLTVESVRDRNGDGNVDAWHLQARISSPEQFVFLALDETHDGAPDILTLLIGSKSEALSIRFDSSPDLAEGACIVQSDPECEDERMHYGNLDLNGDGVIDLVWEGCAFPGNIQWVIVENDFLPVTGNIDWPVSVLKTQRHGIMHMAEMTTEGWTLTRMEPRGDYQTAP